ncbi:acetylxylan esterase [Acidicapsa dinghuensis]|uniref:Acetylxylan esterase n=1 Tax=Acidicapsa dinghuensis TaxID=2218256 RepID=A0ABW1EPE2_9BACT|nr:acetylxylan esterase [Acidicapsa dinghuensis]
MPPHSTSSRCLSIVAILISASVLCAQTATTPRPAPPPPSPEQLKIQHDSEADHQQMMDQLHIQSLRPFRNGMDPKNPLYTNYDESKANPYPDLPDPLTMNDGRKVTSSEMWWHERRSEIMEMFDREMYGFAPYHLPKVTWQVTSTTREKNGDFNIVTKKLVGHVDNSSYPAISVNIEMTLSTPADAKGPVPVIIEFGIDPAVMAAMRKRFEAQGFKFPPTPSGPTWQQQVLAKGWGYAELIPASYQADNGAGLREGIIGLCNKGQYRKPDDWGALKAWAWGASRAIDYFETDKDVNAKEIGITGHSRYGKAAIVAMAYDQRIAIGYISSSGEGGAKLSRRNWGEPIENVANATEYHWMAGNFLKYAGPLQWNDLPVDAHELIAMCAPRPVFISGGATNGPSGNASDGDGWVDAKGMFMAAAAANPVYELLGAKGLNTTTFPPIETPLIQGDLAFRQHTGGHTPAPNWPTFIEFASRYLHTE